MPEPAKLERLPPVTLTSAEVKSVDASERVKVIVAVSPALSALALLVIARVGERVSTVIWAAFCDGVVVTLPARSV